MITGINKNPIKLPYGHAGKIQANVFVDDRAGIFETIDILDMALINMQAHDAISEFEQFEPYTT